MYFYYGSMVSTSECDTSLKPHRRTCEPFYLYRIDYISDTLSLLLCPAMQLYDYASVYADMFSVEYTIVNT